MAEFNKYINNDDFSDKNAEIAALQGAIKFQGQATTLVPVDTGRLKGSIHRLKDGNDYLVGTNVDYAPYIEFGTANTQAQSFLRASAYIIKNQSINTSEFKNYLNTIGSK